MAALNCEYLYTENFNFSSAKLYQPKFSKIPALSQK